MPYYVTSQHQSKQSLDVDGRVRTQVEVGRDVKASEAEGVESNRLSKCK